MQELELRIKAILRRYTKQQEIKLENPIVQIGKYRFNASSRELIQGQETKSLVQLKLNYCHYFVNRMIGSLTGNCLKENLVR